MEVGVHVPLALHCQTGLQQWAQKQEVHPTKLPANSLTSPLELSIQLLPQSVGIPVLTSGTFAGHSFSFQPTQCTEPFVYGLTQEKCSLRAFPPKAGAPPFLPRVLNGHRRLG